jgi:hypothetical protein
LSISLHSSSDIVAIAAGHENTFPGAIVPVLPELSGDNRTPALAGEESPL